MTRPFLLGKRTIPRLNSGTLGFDPGEPIEDVSEPIDRAAESGIAYVPFQASGEPALVQSATAVEGLLPNVSVTLDSPPTPGNLLVAIQVTRETPTPQGPSGWTAHPDGVAHAQANTAYKLGMWYKVAGIGESATVTASASSGANHRLVVLEFTGATASVDDSNELNNESGTTLDIDVTTTGDAIIVAGYVITVPDSGAHTQSVTPDADSTEVVDVSHATNFKPLTWVGYRIVEGADTYVVGGTSSANQDGYGAQAIAFPADPSPLTYIEAPNTIDGDDDTFDYVYDVTATAIRWRALLDNTYLIGSATVRIAFENAGSKTVTLQGANEDDFSDATTVASATPTGTGSFTAQDIELSWTPTTAYRNWQIVLGAAEDVRVHEVELFDADTSGGGITDHGALSGLGDDDHPQYVVTVEDDEANVTVSPATTLQFEADDFTVSDEGSGVAKVTFVGTAAGAITVGEDGDTPVANVDTVIFDGATVTDDGGGQVTVGITASGGGLTHAYVGTNTIGGSSGVSANRIYLKKITLASACVMTSIGVYVKQVTAGQTIGLGVALLTDSAGDPAILIAGNTNPTASFFLSTSNGAAGAARWVDLPLGAYVAAGTYWLAVNLQDSSSAHHVYWDGSGTDRHYTPSAMRMSDAGWTTVTTTTNNYSIRAGTIS